MTKLLATTTLLLTLFVSPLIAKETFYNCKLTKYVFMDSFKNVLRVLEEKDLKPEIEAQMPKDVQWKFKSTFSMKLDGEYITFSQNQSVFVVLGDERKTITRVKQTEKMFGQFSFEDNNQDIFINFDTHSGGFISKQGHASTALIRIGNCKKF